MTPMTPVELSLLRFAHVPVDPGPCRVCGAELVVARSGGGEPTKWVCGSPEANFLAASRRDNEAGNLSVFGPEYRAAMDHWSASERLIDQRADPRVIAVVDELIAVRAAAGEDMTVPVGAVHFPYGHGQSLCRHYVEHVGEGVWENRLDLDYTHDPTHGYASDDNADGTPDGL